MNTVKIDSEASRHGMDMRSGVPMVGDNPDQRIEKMLVCALLAVFIAVFGMAFASAASAQGSFVKGKGTFTAVESDGTLIINGSGYLIDPDARIVNARGKSCSIEDLKLPTMVFFDYISTSRGPVIRRLKEMPR